MTAGTEYIVTRGATVGGQYIGAALGVASGASGAGARKAALGA